MLVRSCIVLVICLLGSGAGPGFARIAQQRGTPQVVIVQTSSDSLCVLAAREVQRYIHLRTGRSLAITSERPSAIDAIVLEVDAQTLDAEAFLLKTHDEPGRTILRIAGGSPLAVLYGSYRFAELMGVRFELQGDVIPDRPFEFDRLPLVDETHGPLFALRGIQPFHDFTEGPDWWDEDDYRVHVAQLAKLRMNFLGLHCYPEGPVGPEPLVWIGLSDDVDPEGNVAFSYPSRWASTQGGAWGYDAMPTGKFAAGASLLFAADDFGPEVTAGHRPMPVSPEAANEVFNRAGALVSQVVQAAHQRGVRVCVGTETPLTVPEAVADRLRARGLDPASPEVVRRLYEGMFTRLQRLGPVDHYWLWTPEGWTWQGADASQSDAAMRDIELADRALANLGDPFALATCGWVLGPPGDPTLFDRVLPHDVPLSCINRDVGFDPVEPGFARVQGRSKWAIPWMEDDPALIAAQLWAGRMRRDAADALAFGCDGLMGIHWRTRALSPQIQTLAQAAWDQSGWNPQEQGHLEPPTPATVDVHIGGAVADYPRNPITGAPPELARVYQTCRWNLEGYRIEVPDEPLTVTLRFCEVHYREPGKRVFGVKLQGRQVAGDLDVFARVGANAALDLTLDNIVPVNAELQVDFIRQVEFPFIAGIEVRTASGFVKRINCGGPKVGDYLADFPPMGTYPALVSRPRDLPVGDFYLDWARSQFGEGVAADAAAIFTELDGSPSEWRGRAADLPRPSDWDRGPGGIKINRTPWSTEQGRYAFVDQLEALRTRVEGAASLERFDYWLNTMRALRETGHLGCLRGQLDAVMERVSQSPDEVTKALLAQREALPARLELARSWERLIALQLALVSNRGEMGTIANLEQHVRSHLRFFTAHDEQLALLLHGLPPAAEPSTSFLGQPRLFVPTVRTDVRSGEVLDITAIVLDGEPAPEVTLHVRTLGAPRSQTTPMQHIARGVWVGTLPPAGQATLEYWLTATTADGELLAWPPGAPDRTQTVVVSPF